MYEYLNKSLSKVEALNLKPQDPKFVVLLKGSDIKSPYLNIKHPRIRVETICFVVFAPHSIHRRHSDVPIKFFFLDILRYFEVFGLWTLVGNCCARLSPVCLSCSSWALLTAAGAHPGGCYCSRENN